MRLLSTCHTGVQHHLDKPSCCHCKQNPFFNSVTLCTNVSDLPARAVVQHSWVRPGLGFGLRLGLGWSQGTGKVSEQGAGCGHG